MQTPFFQQNSATQRRKNRPDRVRLSEPPPVGGRPDQQARQKERKKERKSPSPCIHSFIHSFIQRHHFSVELVYTALLSYLPFLSYFFSPHIPRLVGRRLAVIITQLAAIVRGKWRKTVGNQKNNRDKLGGKTELCAFPGFFLGRLEGKS